MKQSIFALVSHMTSVCKQKSVVYIMGVLEQCVLSTCLLVSFWAETRDIHLSQPSDASGNVASYAFPTLGAYNFMAVLTSKAGVCSGVLVAKEWVLSAAHCFYFREKAIGPGDARIIAGIINYEYPSPYKQESMSKKIYIHPKFKYTVPSKYDVALVMLQDPFEFTKNVGSVAVAGDEWPQNPNGTWCMALGFGGYMSTAPTSSDLKAWNMTAEHGKEACPCALQFQSKRLVCVKEQSNPLMCQGDDGGPLVCGSVVRAIGHMVWDRVACDEAIYPTPKCARGPDHALTTYTFLCPLADWMHEIVEIIPPKPYSCGGPSLSPSVFVTVFSTFIFFRFIFFKK